MARCGPMSSGGGPTARPWKSADWNNPDHRMLIADLYRPVRARRGEPRAGRAECRDGRASGSSCLSRVAGHVWRRVIDSAAPEPRRWLPGTRWTSRLRTALLLRRGTGWRSRRRRGTRSRRVDRSERCLARLAEAAGLAHDWWDIDGRQPSRRRRHEARAAPRHAAAGRHPGDLGREPLQPGRAHRLRAAAAAALS